MAVLHNCGSAFNKCGFVFKNLKFFKIIFKNKTGLMLQAEKKENSMKCEKPERIAIYVWVISFAGVLKGSGRRK